MNPKVNVNLQAFLTGGATRQSPVVQSAVIGSESASKSAHSLLAGRLLNG